MENLLKDWLIGKDLSLNEEKKFSKLMDNKILHEFTMHDESTWFSWNNFESHKYVYNWILLETGHAIGWNENPARGWSFPSKKLSGDILDKVLIKCKK